MLSPKNISIQDYTYELPDSRIAMHPLEQRDRSKLLVWNKGTISEDIFYNISTHIPSGSMMVFNNSKVINARMVFTKPTGSRIEIFCLEPYGEIKEYALIMNKKGAAQWKCFIGGVAKWKEEYLTKEILYQDQHILLKAKIEKKISDAYIVSFEWTPHNTSFAEVLMAAGDIPLPPYIKRAAAKEDANRYQTIYAKEEGSVAAPTAGLHFSEPVFHSLQEKNIHQTAVCLHVGAGTFKPVKAATMEGHEMHAEWIEVSVETIKNLIHQDGLIIAVGTTSLRTIESLYWLGVKTILDHDIQQLEIGQWDAYELAAAAQTINRTNALTALIQWLSANQKTHLFTQTQLLITPGYSFRVANALVTNFHQPQSTLLLLVAAAMGDDWKKCYDYALEHDFRFLSYGDGSLVFF